MNDRITEIAGRSRCPLLTHHDVDLSSSHHSIASHTPADLESYCILGDLSSSRRCKDGPVRYFNSGEERDADQISDPPSLASTSELRDLSLQPSQVRSANISIIHPQLRDLILPLARGCVLYPRGQTLEWQRWMETTDESPLTGLVGTFLLLRFTSLTI